MSGEMVDLRPMEYGTYRQSSEREDPTAPARRVVREEAAGASSPTRLGLEAVAHTRLGQQVLRARGIGLELASQLRDVDP